MHSFVLIGGNSGSHTDRPQPKAVRPYLRPRSLSLRMKGDNQCIDHSGKLVESWHGNSCFAFLEFDRL